MSLFVFTFLLALLVSLVVTPLVRKLAASWGFVDRPDGGRKAHENPISLGGGVVIFLATLVAFVFVLILLATQGISAINARNQTPLIALLISAVVIVLVGLIDDKFNLRGRYKLLGQILAASVLLFAGLRIDSFTILHYQVEFEWWTAIAFTLFWILGSINSINLIDGIDGLATTVGFVLCLTLAAITAWMGLGAETMLMVALAGALLGFLRYNFAPASIFLGDAGSMLIGLVIGTAALFSSTKGVTAVALAVPVAVWSIPILDSLAAILRRKLTGRSLFTPDSGHLHHSLLMRGWSVRQAVLFIGLIASTTCLSAFLSYYYQNEFIALVTVAIMAIFLIVTKTFGHIELALLTNQLRWTARALSSSEDIHKDHVYESCVQLQGSRQWDKLWCAITESAQSHCLLRLTLTINIPSLRETFFATWDCKSEKKESARLWKISNPLIVDGQIVGGLEITGSANGGSAFPHMIQVLDFLEAIESDIQPMISVFQVEISKSSKDSSSLDAKEKPELPTYPAKSLSSTA